MKEGRGMIVQLINEGYSKYRIAKELNVSWQTVHMWSKKVFTPNQNHMQKLEELLNGAEKNAN